MTYHSLTATGGRRWSDRTAPDDLVCRGDRLAVLHLGVLDVPSAARSAAAERIDLHRQLVARLDGLAGPAITHQRARARPLKIPHRVLAVLVNLQQNERVRAGELELLHRAGELNRVFLIEHREGVVGNRRAA